MPSTPAAPDTLLLCLSHLRWNFVLQRPQHLLSRAAKQWPVVFYEEPIYRDDIAVARLDVSHPVAGVSVAVPLLPAGTSPQEAVRHQRRLLDQLLAGFAPERLVAWFYTPMAMAFASHLSPDVVVYDCMDQLASFRGAPPELVRFERQLMQRADLVFTGGQSLFEAKRGMHPRVSCFPSSIDVNHYRPARGQLEEPAEMAALPRPRLGFFGVVDERMDLALLDQMAELRPHWSFVMIGPVVKISEAELPRRANIHWLGGRRYDELPRYLGHWDIGLMNFALNESTRYISPTKTPEFLAAGLPVVSTPIVDVVRGYGNQGLVEIASDALQAVAAAEHLLARPRQPWLAKVDRALAQSSWDRTWAEMQAQIVGVLENNAVPVTARAGVRTHA